MDILIFLIPLLSAIIGSYLTYYFTIKSKKKESILKFKEEKYINLLIFFQGFVGKTASGDVKRRFFEEQYRSWLYASDEVVLVINDIVNMVIDSKGKDIDQGKGKNAIGKIVLEMREDLLGRTKLLSKDFTYTDVID